MIASPRVGLAIAVRNSTVAYVESKGQPVVELDDVRLDVGPLYNTKAQQGDYPAPVVLRAHLPHGGEVEVHGAVDAFAKPHVAVARWSALPMCGLDFLLIEEQGERLLSAYLKQFAAEQRCT